MIDVPIFSPKIYIKYPEYTETYLTVTEAYSAWKCHQRLSAPAITSSANTNFPYYICRNCNEAHNKKSDFSKNCITYKRVRDYSFKTDHDKSWYLNNLSRYKTLVIYSHHNFIPVPIAITELGEEVEWPEVKKSFYKGYLYSTGHINKRRLLKIDRDKLDAEAGWPFHYEYRYIMAINYGKSYRKPKTTNERRQYFAANLDERAPQVRGRRSYTSIANAWDDLHTHYDKTWKRRKIKKQWMVNLLPHSGYSRNTFPDIIDEDT